MKFFTMEYAEFLLRIIIAAVCGFAIGYERKNRGKGAGIRTHMIVGIASALMMVVSKYGFADLVDYPGSRGADSSRIAAQVISGVGFLGAGMIYVQRQAVKGLTTAAGIWSTSGVGLAVGAGMYFIGIASSVFIIVMQVILHRNYKILQMPNEEQLSVTLKDTSESMDYFESVLNEFDIKIMDAEFKKVDDGYVKIEVTANVPHELDVLKFMKETQKSENVRSVRI